MSSTFVNPVCCFEPDERGDGGTQHDQDQEVQGEAPQEEALQVSVLQNFFLSLKKMPQ